MKSGFMSLFPDWKAFYDISQNATVYRLAVVAATTYVRGGSGGKELFIIMKIWKHMLSANKQICAIYRRNSRGELLPVKIIRRAQVTVGIDWRHMKYAYVSYFIAM